jgi:hypothetical protein
MEAPQHELSAVVHGVPIRVNPEEEALQKRRECAMRLLVAVQEQTLHQSSFWTSFDPHHMRRLREMVAATRAAARMLMDQQ